MMALNSCSACSGTMAAKHSPTPSSPSYPSCSVGEPASRHGDVRLWSVSDTAYGAIGSLRLARRLGFTLDGTLRRRILEDDRRFPHCALFGLPRAEWEKTACVAAPYRPSPC